MKNKVVCHRHCISHTNTSSMVCTVVCRWYTLALECMRCSVRWTQTNCWYILCIYNDCWYIFKGQLSESEYGVTDWLVLYTARKHYYSIYLQYSAYIAYYSIQPYCSIHCYCRLTLGLLVSSTHCQTLSHLYFAVEFFLTINYCVMLQRSTFYSKWARQARWPPNTKVTDPQVYTFLTPFH